MNLQNQNNSNSNNTNKFRLLFFIIFYLVVGSCFGQTITFQKAIVEPNISYFRSVVQTPDDGYIAVGRKRETFTNDFMYIVRFNKFGDTLWTKTINREEAVSVTKTNDNNYALIGVNGSFVKFDINGTISAIGSFYDSDLRINKILQVPDNSYFICGRYFPSTSYPYLGKFNSNGVLLWDTVYSENILYGLFDDMVLANDNYLILNCEHQLQSGQPSYMCIAKINQTGNYLWSNTIFNYPYFYASSITQTNTGDFIACSRDYLIKFNSQGVLIWRKIQDSVLSVDFLSITTTFDGNYVYTGWLDSAGYSYVRIRKTDTSGTEIWRKLHGFADKNQGGDEIRVTKDSGFIVVGRTYIQGEDPYILKTDKNGNLLPPIGIITLNEGIPDKFSLSQNFPNPFNPNTTIHFKIPKLSKIILRVYDLQGKLVKVLVDKELGPASYSVSLELNNYSTGVYFICLLSNNILVKSIKISLIK